MKRIFLLLSFLVCFFVSKAQILQKQNTYGIGFNRTGADTLIYIPSDTLSVPSWGVGKTHIARKGTTLYYWDGSKWSAISGSGGTYTAGNGLTLSGSQFELGGALSKPTSITGNYKLFLNNRHTHIQGDTVYFASNTNNLINLNSSGGLGDELLLEANGGAIRFTSVSDLYMPAPIFTGTVSSGASTDSILTVNTLTGEVRKRQLSEVVSTPTLQQVLTAGSTLTTNHTIDFGGNDLKIKGDSLQIVNTDGDVRIKLIPSAGGVGSAATRLTFINADAAEMFIQSGDEYLETYSGWYIRNEIGDNPALSVNGKTGGQTAPYIEVLQGAEKLFEIDADSFSINPPLGVLNIDSLRTWSGISDTTYKKPMTWDTRNGRWEYAANWYGGGGGGITSLNGQTGATQTFTAGNGIDISSSSNNHTFTNTIDSLDNFSDVTITSIQKGQMIYYDSVTSKYINGYDNDRRNNTMEYFEDFLYFVGTNAGVHYNPRASGASSFSTISSWDYAETSIKRPGMWALVTGTASNGYGMVDMFTNNAYAMRVRAGYYNGETEWKTSFALHNESNSTDEYVAYMGYMSSGISAEPTDGVYFKYDRANYGDTLVLVAANGGTRSQVTTNVLITSNAVDKWLSLRLVVNDNATSMRAYYKTETGNWTEITAITGTYPIVSNFPAGSNTVMVSQSIIRKTAGTATRVMLLDYIGIRQEIPKGR